MTSKHNLYAFDSCLNRRNDRNRKLVGKKLHFLIGLLLALCQFHNSSAGEEDHYTVCKTAECQQLATTLKSVLNFSVSPCDDFSAFVCAVESNSRSMMADAVLQRTVKLLGTPTIEEAKTTVDSARALYQGCINSASLDRSTLVAQVNQHLRNFGGMPLLPDSGYVASLDWMEKLAAVYRQLPMNAIIGYEIIHDLKHEAPKYISFSEIEEFGLHKDILIAENEFGKKKVRNQLLLIKFIVCFIRGGQCGKDDVVDNAIKKLTHFEVQLAKITTNSGKKKKMLNRYRKRTIGHLMKEFPQLKWSSFMEYLFQETDISVSYATEVVFMDEDFFIRLVKLLNQTEPETLANYIGWRIIDHMPLISTTAFRQFAMQYAPYLPIAKPVSVDVLRHHCVDIAISLFPHSIGKLYVEYYFPAADKQKIETMVINILRSMKNMLEDSAWMDEPTREEALKKVQHMKKYIAYPDWVSDDFILERYEGLPEWCNRSSFIESLMKTYHYRECKKLTHINKISKSDNWVISAAEMKAYYSPMENSLYFAAGIIQPPYFYPNTIESVNYGAQGFVVGHEISHGFDQIGNEFDGDGILRSWWTNTTRREFDKSSECFVEQYGNIVDKVTNLKLNGKITLKENIADNSGLRRAYEAYMMTYPKDVRLPGLEKFTHIQLFFISYGRSSCQLHDKEVMRKLIEGNDHLPGIYRILIPTKNMKAFSDAFHCAKGAEMNPENRCEM